MASKISNYFFSSKEEKDRILKKIEFSYYIILILVPALVLASLPLNLYNVYDHFLGIILYIFAFWLLLESKSLLDAKDVISRLEVREGLKESDLIKYPLYSMSRRCSEKPIDFQEMVSSLEGSSQIALFVVLLRRVRRQ